MKMFLNYLGQFRLYSLIDLILLMIATRAGIQKKYKIYSLDNNANN